MKQNSSPKYQDIYSFAKLYEAFCKARRAKRGKGGEPAFYRNLEDELSRLSVELESRTYRPLPYRYFKLRNKKERTVSEAAFRDRVVHHSLVSAIEPVFENRFIAHSYACRKGKGSHKAVFLARKLAGRHRYFLKLDVAAYFDNVEHDILMSLLSEQLQDEGILWLCRALLDGSNVPAVRHGERKALPIGNLTSQFWANVYLDPVDKLVTSSLGRSTYLRYMDDMLIFAEDKTELWEISACVRSFLRDELALKLKDKATIVAPVTEGVPWLGFRVFPGIVLADRCAKRRFSLKLKKSREEATRGWHSEDAAVAGVTSLCGHLSQANTLQFRRGVLDRIESNAV